MNYQKTSQQCLGVDPGIANAGIGIVSHAKNRYDLLHSECVKTSSKDKRGKRYLLIYERLTELIAKHDINIIAVEAVYFNINRTSNQTTAGVIALVEMVSAEMDIQCLQVRPQTVKMAVGAQQNASKEAVQRMIAKLLRVELKSHHSADAVGAALAGILAHRSFDAKKCGVP